MKEERGTYSGKCEVLETFSCLWGQRLQTWGYQDVSGHEVPKTSDGMNTLDVFHNQR